MLPIRIYFEFQRDLPSTDWKMITAIAAVAISFIALFFSIYNSYRGRRHDRLSVKPWLHLYKQLHSGGDTGFYVKNNGVGPAIITDFIIYLDNEMIEKTEEINRWETVIDICKIPRSALHYNFIPTPFWLPPKEHIDLCSMNFSNKNDSEKDEFNEAIKRIKIKVV